MKKNNSVISDTTSTTNISTCGLVVGRFQPLHNAHLKLIRISLSKYDKTLILIGSARQSRDIHNPFTFDERKNMILSSLTNDEVKKVSIKPVRDYLYNDNLWLSEVQRLVDEEAENAKVFLVAHNRDKSSYYINMLPQFELHEVGRLEHNISASEIRKLYLETTITNFRLISLLPKAVCYFLDNFTRTQEFLDLVEEYAFIAKYKSSWACAPYPPTFVTTDCVLIKSGHVLLVKRKFAPGKNLLAFPGGYLHQDEDMVDGMLRELKEETSINVPKDVLKSSIIDEKLFSSPYRDNRGRVITNAYCINLGHGVLPKVRGGDDASSSFWMPLHEAFAKDEQFFADHWHILQFFTSKF